MGLLQYLTAKHFRINNLKIKVNKLKIKSCLTLGNASNAAE